MFFTGLPFLLSSVFEISLWAIQAQASAPISIPLIIQVEEITHHLVGVMDTAAQARTNPERVSVQMTTCSVEVLDMTPTGGQVLYQEQALSNQVDEPYRQRFLHIVPNWETQQVESQTYKPDQPEQWVGLCDRADSMRRIALADLGTYLCKVELRPTEQGYIGQTPEAGCPTSARGAVMITNTVVLHDNGMDTWDRGFDAAGLQVWGADEEGYEYRWRDRN